MFVNPLRAAFSRARASAGPEESSAVTLVGVASEVQRERPVVREAVEGAAARDAAGEHAILALIEKGAGLLPVPRRGQVADAVLGHLDLARNVAVEQLRGARETLLRAHGGVVARENAVGREQLAKRVDDRRAERLEPCAQELNDEPLVVAIDDERRQSVGLAMHDAIRIRVSP